MTDSFYDQETIRKKRVEKEEDLIPLDGVDWLKTQLYLKKDVEFWTSEIATVCQKD